MRSENPSGHSVFASCSRLFEGASLVIERCMIVSRVCTRVMTVSCSAQLEKMEYRISAVAPKMAPRRPKNIVMKNAGLAAAGLEGFGL